MSRRPSPTSRSPRAAGARRACARAHAGRGVGQGGMTLFEIMIVLAVIGGLMFMGLTGLRALTSADVAGASTEMAALMRRASQMAVETGQVHRLYIDLERQGYAVEVCQGARTLTRGSVDAPPDGKKIQDALQRGQQRLGQLPTDALTPPGNPEEAAQRAAALAGHHLADRQCVPATEDKASKKDPVPLVRALAKDDGLKVREVWVAHLPDSVTSGQVAIYFFPNGSAEKAIVDLTDGDATFSLLVYGLTGKVAVRGSPLRNPDDHMLRNAQGDREQER